MAAYSACKKGTLITGSRQDFRFFLLDLCLGTAPQNMGTAPQSMGTAPKKLEATPLSRPLVTLHPWFETRRPSFFCFFVLFSVCLSFVIIPRTASFFFCNTLFFLCLYQLPDACYDRGSSFRLFFFLMTGLLNPKSEKSGAPLP